MIKRILIKSVYMVCGKCGVDRPLTDYRLVKGEIKKPCKPCLRDYRREWNTNNPDRASANNLKYASKHREELRQRIKEYREKYPEIALETAKRYRAKHLEEIKIREKEYYEKNKVRLGYVREIPIVKKKNSQIEWAKKNPEKKKAHGKVRNLIRTGKETRPSECSICLRKKKVDGHHPDYAKPLYVIWVCRSCHRKIHTGSLLI